MIEALSCFSLARHDGPYDTWPDATRLFFEQRDTGRKLRGFALEAQFRVDDRYLLVTSYDCPFEELTRFYLLDARFRILGHVWKGWAYTSWLLKSITPESAATFVVDFGSAPAWRLSVRRTRWMGVGRLLSLKRLGAGAASQGTGPSAC